MSIEALLSSAVVVAAFKFIEFLISRNDAKNGKRSMTEEALQCLLRNELLRSCREASQRGSADASERANLAKMYRAYDRLGGNDVAHDAYEIFRKLPFTEEE